jgi:hypothetical protein
MLRRAAPLRKACAALAVLAAVASAPASAEWYKNEQFNFCDYGSYEMRMLPAVHRPDYNSEAWASAQLRSAGFNAFTLRLHFVPGSAGPVLDDASHNLSEVREVAADAVGIRIRIDGTVIRYAPPQTYKWLAADPPAWRAALLSGNRLTAEYVNDAGAIVATRELELEPIREMIRALRQANWSC